MKQIELKEAEKPHTELPNKTFIVGTRGSKLALWQTNWLIEELKKARPGLQIETRVFTTRGDQIQDVPLQSVGDDGFFVRELETALLAGEIDLAIHSLKDLPTKQPEGLHVAVTPERVDARDAIFSRQNIKLADLPQGAVIGTSSARRVAQLRNYRPDFQIKELRGNIDTRMRKLHEQDYDAVILAAAGVKRIGRLDEAAECIPLNLMLPAPGQGALAPECRVDDTALLDILNLINDRNSLIAVKCEREFMAALGGGCQTPVGAYAEIVMQQLVLRAFIGSPDGSRKILVEIQEPNDGSLAQAKEVALRLAEEALNKGAREILDDARKQGYITERK
ncbi:hydroxymethylbilane synthase [Candidatus Chlorohelix sp.]|uniref:hydroxymethylbilane synthase n=1 Tax=Candidatus Chlorohelix sp. TaxID=3139201 RepID=UPI00302E50B0